MTSPYLFFFSYNREEWDEPELLRTFYERLRDALRTATAWPQDRLGFLDKQDIPLGADWPTTLAEGLRSCRVFLPLYHPRYFSKRACGQEWTAFRRRQQAFVDQHQDQPLPDRIVPILWGPPESLKNTLPEVASRLQFDHPSLGADYIKYGLASLLRPPEQGEAVKQAVQEIARRIAEAWKPETVTLPLLPASVAFENLPSAWDLKDGAVRVADGWRLEKLCDRGEQADLFVERFPARLSEAPESPQAYLIFGERTELPESLIDRLVDVELHRKLSDLQLSGRWPSEITTVLAKTVEWPRGGELQDLQRRLLTRLLDAFNGTSTGPRPGAADILAAAGFPRNPVVAISHEVWLSDKKAAAVSMDLARWYVDEFWTALPPGSAKPLILLFIALITDPDNPALAKQVRRGMEKLANGGSRPTRAVLPPLDPVTDADLREWFNRYTDIDALSRELRINAILGQARIRNGRSVSMDITEAQLIAMIEGTSALGTLKVKRVA